MNKVSNFKYWIVSFSIISILCLVIGYTTYYFLEQNRLIKEAYPYPALYDAVKKECPALLNGNEYLNKTTRDNGLTISGESTFQHNGKNRRFRVAVLRKRLVVFFVKQDVDKNFDDLKTEEYEAITVFDSDTIKFHERVSEGDPTGPHAELKKVFEQEMKERLKSC